MACCGKTRLTFVGQRPVVARPAPSSPVAANRPRAPVAAPAPGGLVALRSVAAGGMVVRGPATGRQYTFSAAAQVQMVEARDAAALLRTSWFRQA
jgi:hypothetical protein